MRPIQHASKVYAEAENIKEMVAKGRVNLAHFRGNTRAKSTYQLPRAELGVEHCRDTLRTHSSICPKREFPLMIQNLYTPCSGSPCCHSSHHTSSVCRLE